MVEIIVAIVTVTIVMVLGLIITIGSSEDVTWDNESQKHCEHEYEFLCFDNTCMGIGIVKGVYRCRKCGKVISM